MKKALSLTSLFIFVVFLCKAQSCTLKTNGFYYFKLNEEHSALLRFYEDGTVLASSSTNDYKEVETWFRKENTSMVLNGKYKLKKCKADFDVEGMSGKQDYDIEISGDELIAVITDNKAGKKTKREYKFYKLNN